MKNKQFQSDSITSLIRARFDVYIKTACKNMLKDYYRKQNRASKNGITFKPLSKDEYDCPYEETGFIKAEAEQISIFGYHFFITDEKLAKALKNLPERNMITLVLHVAADIPLQDIAKILGVSESMVKKYKKIAIEKTRRLMLYGEEV